MALTPRELARAVYGDAFPVVDRYAELLATEGIHRGLLGPREAGRIWDRHILNSAAIAEVVPQRTRVADVGSGAGLPGLPLTILRDDVTVTLIEPLRRRTTFLSEVVDELSLTERVEVVRGRAEDMEGRSFGIVTSRALAPLDRLARWCLPLTDSDGEIVALKGRSASEEVVRHAGALERAGLDSEARQVCAHPEAEPTFVVRLWRRSPID